MLLRSNKPIETLLSRTHFKLKLAISTLTQELDHDHYIVFPK